MSVTVYLNLNKNFKFNNFYFGYFMFVALKLILKRINGPYCKKVGHPCTRGVQNSKFRVRVRVYSIIELEWNVLN